MRPAMPVTVARLWIAATMAMAAAGHAGDAAAFEPLPPDLATRPGEDWPDFLGPRRNGTSAERGVSFDWPEKGPPIVWQTKLGTGYAARGNVQGNGTGVVAFDKRTGKVVWTASNELASYASPVAAEIDGRPWCFVYARGGLVGLDPRTGTVDFEYPWRASLAAFSTSAATIASSASTCAGSNRFGRSPQAQGGPCHGAGEAAVRQDGHPWPILYRGREARLGSGPPSSEPCWRISRTRLSG